MNNLRERAAKWVEEFLDDPIGTAWTWGWRIVEIAVGLFILLVFLSIARSCVGL